MNWPDAAVCIAMWLSLNPRPRNLVKDPFVKGDSVEQMYETVTHGLILTQMPAFGDVLSEQDRKAVSAYVKSLRTK